MSPEHKNLAEGGWQKLTLAEQMANIGSEISRAIKWREKDKNLFQKALIRALELFDLTILDPRWKSRLKEITRAREIFCDTVFGDKKYATTLHNLLRYFDIFAFAARRNR